MSEWEVYCDDGSMFLNKHMMCLAEPKNKNKMHMLKHWSDANTQQTQNYLE